MNVAEYRNLIKPTEKVIQQEIINYLRNNGYYVMRLNSGMSRVRKTYQRKDGSIYDKETMLRLGEPGTPDVMAFVPCPYSQFNDEENICPGATHLLFIEVKRPGNKPTDLQNMKMAELQDYGAKCIVAHSVEELQQKL